MDTTSRDIVEFRNDYFVHAVDSSLELHYELWSRNASIWLTVLNKTKDLAFIDGDSSYVQYDGKKYAFDLFVDWPEYERQLVMIPNFEEYDIGRVFPIMPGMWKGLLSPELPFRAKDWAEINTDIEYDQLDSPVVLEVNLTYFLRSGVGLPRRVRDKIWVQSISLMDPPSFRGMTLDTSVTKTDKFYITNSAWVEN